MYSEVAGSRASGQETRPRLTSWSTRRRCLRPPSAERCCQSGQVHDSLMISTSCLFPDAGCTSYRLPFERSETFIASVTVRVARGSKPF